MTTELLNGTNLMNVSRVNYSTIEQELGIEIAEVYNYKEDRSAYRISIDPGTVIYPTNYNFKYLDYSVKSVSFDKETMILTYVSRKKWGRTFSEHAIQLGKIGYKMPTTKLGEGYIYGIKFTN